jgi:hypothetical protein
MDETASNDAMGYLGAYVFFSVLAVIGLLS